MNKCLGNPWGNYLGIISELYRNYLGIISELSAARQPARTNNSVSLTRTPTLGLGIISELSWNYLGIISDGAVSGTAARDPTTTRAGDQDDVSYKQTPSNHKKS